MSKKLWGYTKNGEEVYLYTLKNEFLEVEIINYGAVIRKISSPDREGKFENVVLNLPTIKDYEEKSPYFGAIIGRVAGRVKNGILKFDGNEYQLNKNSGKNTLHGGIENFGKKVWEGEEFSEKDCQGVRLTLKSPDMEEGFPGNVDIIVEYKLIENELHIEIRGTTDRKTYLNLTNHTYFNLSGDFKEDIKNLDLTLNSSSFAEVDEETLPINVATVKNTLFDFRDGKKLNSLFSSDWEQIKIVNQGIDHSFILDKGKTAVVLEDSNNGRRLEITTNQDAVVIYTGNYLYEVGKLNEDVTCEKYFGICFETQNYTDTLNFIPEKAVFTTPTSPYYHKTVYRFQVMK